MDVAISYDLMASETLKYLEHLCFVQRLGAVFHWFIDFNLDYRLEYFFAKIHLQYL